MPIDHLQEKVMRPTKALGSFYPKVDTSRTIFCSETGQEGPRSPGSQQQTVELESQPDVPQWALKWSHQVAMAKGEKIYIYYYIAHIVIQD